MAGEWSNGAAAGLLISDQIQGRSSPWAKLYDPRRPSPKKYNKGGDTHSLVGSIDEIPRDQGGVIKRGKAKLAVHRAANGRVRALSASCTHAGCTVSWNNADLTWDCPCHGSRFSATGQVIHGPATKPLPSRKLPKAKTKRRRKKRRAPNGTRPPFNRGRSYDAARGARLNDARAKATANVWMIFAAGLYGSSPQCPLLALCGVALHMSLSVKCGPTELGSHEITAHGGQQGGQNKPGQGGQQQGGQNKPGQQGQQR